MLFIISINDVVFFLDKTKIENYADDNTTYAIENDIMELLKTLESVTCSVLNWFRMNEMKPNQNKCHLLIADVTHNYYSSNSFKYLDNAFMEIKESLIFSGAHIVQNLDFEEHIICLLKKGNNKLHTLMHVEIY